MRTAIVIPARLGATRLPDKPLVDLGGKPMVVRTAEQARKCRRADVVIVATDHPNIANALVGTGVRAVLTRPDHASGSDRVAEVVADLDVELIVNLQGDEPFVNPRDLDCVIEALESPTADMATLRAEIKDLRELLDPNVVKVVTRDDQTALYFSRAPIPFERAQTGSCAGTYRHIGVYGYRKPALMRLCAAPVHPLERRESLEQLRALAMGLSIAVVSAVGTARGIDTQEDLAWARTRVRDLGDAAFP